MSNECGSGFSPKDPMERIILSFFFTNALSTGEQLQSVQGSTVVTVTGGTDPNPSAILDGLAAINIASPVSVQQPVIGGVLGVTYHLKVACVTNLGQVLVCSGTLTIAEM